MNFGPGRALRRQQVVDDDDEQPGQGEQDEDRRLGLRPQPGHRDDRCGRQEEDPAHDADDPVVGAGRASASVGSPMRPLTTAAAASPRVRTAVAGALAGPAPGAPGRRDGR